MRQVYSQIAARLIAGLPDSWKRSRRTRGSLLVVTASLLCVGGIAALYVGVELGFVPDGSDAETADTNVIQKNPDRETTAAVAPVLSITPSPSDTLMPSDTPAATEAPDIRYVTTSTLKARSCPGVECRVMTEMEYGDSLVVIEREAASDGSIWYCFRHGSRLAWVASSATSPEQPPARPTPQATQVKLATPPPLRPAICSEYPEPGNCATAARYGLPGDVGALCWPKLDVNRDGIACFGSD